MRASSVGSSRCWPIAIALPSTQDRHDSEAGANAKKTSRFATSEILTVAGIFAVLAVMSATGVPGVNETHYLTKAKHFWDPDWCGQDLFLSSSNAHYAFFVLFGWPTTLLSLDAYAWVGRVLCWLAMAYAWMKLNRTLGIGNWSTLR